MTIFSSCLMVVSTILLLSFAWLGLVARCRAVGRRRVGIVPGDLVVAFFHPYCNAGGGGERVLWLAIKALATTLDGQGQKIHVVIYSGEIGESSESILRRAEERHGGIFAMAQKHFGVDLKFEMALSIVTVRGRHRLEAERYPLFTMLGQSLGSMLFAWSCLWCLVPDVYIDTTGCAFTYPVAFIFGVRKIAAYVHYPTISTDMLAMVQSQRPSYNNDQRLASSRLKTAAKVLYYIAFATLYGLCGSFVSLVMVNSSWTRDHICKLWRRRAASSTSPSRGEVVTVHPPCDTSSLKAYALTFREPVILSVGQFRPEKDHVLQLKAFAEFLKSGSFGQVKLVLLGSCRGAEDARRVESLRQLAHDQGIESQVDFVVDAPYSTLRDWLGRASIGLHTMWNEHFGICVVEYMAAGLVPVAHNSGGPRLDIVVPFHGQQSGFLASSPSEYAQAFSAVLTSGDAEHILSIRRAARDSVNQFSDEAFLASFSTLMRSFLQ